MDTPEPVRLITSSLDGKEIAYSTQTVFLVQTGRGKGSYVTRYRFVGELGRAVMYFNMLNICAPFKKRLLMPSSPKPVLARQVGT